MTLSPSLVVLFALSLSVQAGAQSDTQNAAVKYLRADAALRQSYSLPPDAGLKLEEALGSPLSDSDRALIAASGGALTEFQHGAALTACDWAISLEDGPLANTAHRGAITEMVAVSGIRARIRFRDGDPQGAVDDILAGMSAVRHLSLDGSLASVLIAYKLENTIAGILTRNLGLLSMSQLHELRKRLDALPSGSTLDKALEAEKVSRNDLLGIASGVNSRDELIESLLKKAPYLRSDRAVVSEIVDGCGGSISGFASCVEQQRSFFALWASRFNLSPEKFAKEYESEMELLSKTNAVVRLLTPNLPRLRWTEASTQTHRALLRAAITVQMEGPRALERYLDPYDGKPFSYVAVGRGFHLESHLKEGQEPFSLSVGTDSNKK